MNFLKQMMMKLITFCFLVLCYIVAFWALVWFLLGIDFLEGLTLLEKTWPRRMQQISGMTGYVGQKVSREQTVQPTQDDIFPAEETTIDPNLLPDVAVKAPQEVTETEVIKTEVLNVRPVTEPEAEPAVVAVPAEPEAEPAVAAVPAEPVVEVVESVEVVPVEAVPVEAVPTEPVVEDVPVEVVPVEEVPVEPEAEPEVIATEEVVIPNPVVLPEEAQAPAQEEGVEPKTEGAEPAQEESQQEQSGTDANAAEPVSEKPISEETTRATAFPDDVLPLLTEDEDKVAQKDATKVPAETQTVINPGALAGTN